MTCRSYSTTSEASVNVVDVHDGRRCVGHLYRRRGAWAAFRISGERVGTFPTVREASASLGGRA
jgi:hypothetical protein